MLVAPGALSAHGCGCIARVANWPRRGFPHLARVYITGYDIHHDKFPGVRVRQSWWWWRKRLSHLPFPHTQLYKSADALVIPTRGEGWGRPQMEAMAMELPVISTNWSGLTAFLNDETGYPISIEGLIEVRL